MKRVLFAVCLLAAAPLHAATRTWSGAVSAAWSNPANWEEGIVPAAGDALLFPPLSRTTSTNDLANVAYQSLTVTHDQTVNGNTTTVTGGIYVGPLASSASFTNIAVSTPQTWTCDASSQCSFTATITGTTVTVASPRMYITPRGNGTIAQTGGDLALYLGQTPGWTGKLVQSGGTVKASGWEGEAADVESSLTCPWNGCTQGIELNTLDLRSLHASGGYVRTTNQYYTAGGPSLTLGSLFLGSATELDFLYGQYTALFSVAANAAFGTDGTVTLGGGTLSLGPAYTGGAQFVPSGTVITLIDNDGTDPVAGAFAGLPEGATLRARTGQRFRISYTGGSGNDVTLTALANYRPTLDLDGNGKSDILWRHASTGENYRWTMNGAVRASAGPLNAVADLNWKVAAQPDLDGDGDADVLWRHAVSGENYIYLIQDGAIAGAGPLNVVDPSWTVGATGDIDGDGRDDVIWRNQWTNEMYAYLMNGMAIKGAGALRDVSFDWVIGGMGDLNADGRDDIVWSHPSNGEVWVWLLDDFTILDEGHVDYFPGYVVVGVGQFNTRTHPLYSDTDHFTDIVLRNGTTGELDIRIMQGTYFRQRAWDQFGRFMTATVAPEWKIEAVGDYNGDSLSDILWRHSTTGENYVWLFNPIGTNPPYNGYALPEVPDLNWKIVP